MILIIVCDNVWMVNLAMSLHIYKTELRIATAELSRIVLAAGKRSVKLSAASRKLGLNIAGDGERRRGIVGRELRELRIASGKLSVG